MRVLVTGSAGFIGRHVVQALKDRGDSVTSIDKADAMAYDLSRHEASEWLTSRIVDRGTQVIIHLAGSCSTPGSVERPIETFSDTVVCAANVLEAARRSLVPVVLTSSVKARDGRTPYGAAKRMVEAWAIEYRAAYGLPIVINRPGTVYGPGQAGSTESGWIAWFLEAKARGLPVVINGDGMQVRDLLHVDDYVELLLKQADDPDSFNGETYDVGGGWDNAVSVLEIAHNLGLDFTFGPERYGDAPAYVALNDVPGWWPKTHWRAGLEKLTVVPA